MVFRQTDVRAQRPGLGFYCTIRAGALLERLKLQIPFQMHPPTWCNILKNPGLGDARLLGLENIPSDLKAS
jgi:hypothetical protein